MPKILIMVLSYNESPYKELMLAQQDTFDSVEVEGVKTIYYHGGCSVPPNGEYGSVGIIKRPPNSWEEISLQCDDQYYFMAQKMKLALDYVKASEWDYDIIFRTNSSSYVNKKRLLEFAESLPKEKLYAGWTMVDSNHDGGLAVSGAGIWLSRDTAEMLRDQIDPAVEMEEDVYIGRILRGNGIVAIDDRSRHDFTNKHIADSMSRLLATKYHIRCKTANRLQDVANMGLIHKKITING